MRGLGTRRHDRTRLARFGPRARRAVAEGKDVGVPGRLQLLVHHQAVGAIDFQPVEIAQPRWCLDARRPDDQIGGQAFAVLEAHGLGIDRGDPGAGPHGNAQIAQKAGGGQRNAFRERGKDARRRLHDGDVDVLRRREMVEPIARVGAGGLPDLGRELHPGGPGPDDHDVHLAASAAGDLAVGAHARREEPPMEALGVLGRVEGDGMPGHACNAEIVADAAHAEDQRIVRHRARRQDLAAFLVVERSEREHVRRPVEPRDRSLAELETVPVRQRQVGDVVGIGVHPARGDLVQQRLPQVGRAAVDQHHVGAPGLAEGMAQTGGERQAAGATAYDHDAMCGAGARCRPRAHDGAANRKAWCTRGSRKSAARVCAVMLRPRAASAGSSANVRRLVEK